MSRRLSGKGEQLSLDLRVNSSDARLKKPSSGKIVTFVDAGTQDIRREAIKRVINSGIFRYPRVKSKSED